MVTGYRKVVLFAVVSTPMIFFSFPSIAMNGPTAIQIDGGPLGEWELTGGVDGVFYSMTGSQSYSDQEGINYPGTSNAGAKVSGTALLNSLVQLQKTTGILQATIEVGPQNFLYEGLGVTPASIQSYATGPLNAAYITIAPPNSPVTISFGQMAGLEGIEAFQDWGNSNIFYSSVSYVEAGYSRGISVNYTQGAFNATAFLSDGYYTGVFNFLQAQANYTFNSHNILGVFYGGNLGRTGVNTHTYGNGRLAYNDSYVAFAPEFANSQLFGAYYNYTAGNLNLIPEFQFEHASAQHSLGIQKPMTNAIAVVFANYNFSNSPYSLGAWAEYFDQHEGAADAANELYWFYGPNASGEQVSITPTWQYKDLFARVDFGGLHLNRTSAYGLSPYGYGNQHSTAWQFTSLFETGFVF